MRTHTPSLTLTHPHTPSHILTLTSSYRTFAYKTLKDRMPKIVTQVIDTVNREESNLFTKYGEVCECVMCVISDPLYRLERRM